MANTADRMIAAPSGYKAGYKDLGLIKAGEEGCHMINTPGMPAVRFPR
ncbi:hypothetical protein [Bacillus vallismortis]|uniref:Uncharacterized protein n=1 Tax=Bacillus vallismortis TaxID=72361 RepID=A0ABY4Y2A8_BACVA|nr:hypothetical protein [Bacillus vallismortis]USP96291.1 hypothetical protein MKF32_04240 [Bacillus vallismortis]